MVCANGRQGCHFQSNPTYFSAARRLIVRLREAFAHRRQRRALAELDERLLEDVGIKKASSPDKTGKPTWK